MKCLEFFSEVPVISEMTIKNMLVIKYPNKRLRAPPIPNIAPLIIIQNVAIPMLNIK